MATTLDRTMSSSRGTLLARYKACRDRIRVRDCHGDHWLSADYMQAGFDSGSEDLLLFCVGALARQITNSWATPRTSISKSRPCTGGRAKCQVKPPGAGSAAKDLVGQERMDVEDRIDLGCSHARPAEAERRHPLLHRP